MGLLTFGLNVTLDWPLVARDENASRAMWNWARKQDDKPKYVVSASRRDFPRNNTSPLEGVA